MTGLLPMVCFVDCVPDAAKVGRRIRRQRRQSESTGEFEGAPGELP